MYAELASYLIYATLAVLYLTAVHAITYRMLFVDWSLKPCRAGLFHEILGQLNQQGKWPLNIDEARSAGWLQQILWESRFPSAAAAIDDVSSEIESYIHVLTLVTSLSTVLGLLGTVTGFLAAEDVGQFGLNIAFRTTFLGIVVGLPAAIYLGLTQRRREIVLRQCDDFLAELRVVSLRQTTEPNSPPVVPPVKSARIKSDHLTELSLARNQQIEKIAAEILAESPLPSAVDQIVGESQADTLPLPDQADQTSLAAILHPFHLTNSSRKPRNWSEGKP